MSDTSGVSGETVLVTGSTGGIGRALAWRYEGAERLVLTGRRPFHAAGDLPNAARYLQVDQSEPQQAAQALSQELRAAGIDRLDRVFLNAGTGVFREPCEESAAEIRATLDVNLAAAIALASTLFPLLEKAHGRLSLIGSVARSGHPKLASYAASKAGLDGLGRALIEEWRDRVVVSVAHPGPTRTGMHEKAGLKAGRAARFFISPAAMAEMIADASDRPGVRTLSYVALGRHTLTAPFLRGRAR